MKPSLKKLYNYLKLEVSRGYDNRAVVGGLDRILDHWEAEARADELPEELIQLTIQRLRSYPKLSLISRAETLEGLWERIRNTQSVPQIEFIRPEAPSDEVASTEADIEQVLELEPPRSESQERASVTSEPSRETGDKPKEQKVSTAVEEPAALDAPVSVLSGVGKRHAETLARISIFNLRDMLYHFPRRYIDYSRLKPINRLQYGEELTVIGTVQSVNVRKVQDGRFQIVEALISDGSGVLKLNWFNQIWIAKRLRPGMQISVSGKIDQYLGRLLINNPEWEPLEQQQISTNRIVPVYPLTANLTQRWLRRMMNDVITYWAPRVLDPLPADIRKQAGLVDLPNALLQLHFPDSWEELHAARQRLAFDEIFLLQLGVLDQKRAWQEREARPFVADEHWWSKQISRLPFALTEAQQRSLDDIRNDLASQHPMNRLLQGDVGSGKTVIAALAIGVVVQHQAQAAMMAPTSILAEQHYQSMRNLLTGEGADALMKPEEVRLMVGATPESEKQEIRDGLARGAIKLVIGTHALIEDPVVFADLQLVIIDEQHRFGVEQRAALRSKGQNPHLLVMTATPIPRSLALTIYGDLDLTVLDEMPPGRQPVSTYVLMPRELERAYSLIRNQVEQGRQAFMIYPLVEESDKSETKAAVEQHANLQEQVFPQFKLGLLHGRLRPDEKDEVMHRFRNGDYHILVSTTVVEVGVDIPNANVMLIEGANRFGLAQLHQLRGRVGRGAAKAYCLLVPESAEVAENERLQAMVETTDGFVLAERDLEQRGPGQFLGTRQAGFAELQMANLTDVHLIEKARRYAQALFEQDPGLLQPQNQLLANALVRFWGAGKGDVS